MCPLRFILVFFSAVLAGYFAWRTVRSSPEIDADDSTLEKKPLTERSVKTIVENGFWIFVDMASGKYPWRNLKEMSKDDKVKAS